MALDDKDMKRARAALEAQQFYRVVKRHVGGAVYAELRADASRATEARIAEEASVPEAGH